MAWTGASRRAAAALCAIAAAGACSGSDPPSPGHPFSRADIVRTCVFAISCLAENAPIRPVGDCVDQFQTGIGTSAGIFFGPSGAQLEHIVECGAVARDCMEGLACASYGHGPPYCSANPGATCDGNIRVVCDSASGWAYESEDCAALGLACHEGMTAAGTMTAVCGDGTPCDEGSFPATCEGSRVLDCTTIGIRASLDCATLGIPATCGTITNEDGTTEQGCIAVGPACDYSGSRCDGTAIVACSGGREARLDCSAILEGHCEIDSSTTTPYAVCVPDATECTFETPDACDGASLRSCVNGRFASTPCGDLGFGGCGADASGNALCVL
jgi:hypothetical protein